MAPRSRRAARRRSADSRGQESRTPSGARRCSRRRRRIGLSPAIRPRRRVGRGLRLRPHPGRREHRSSSTRTAARRTRTPTCSSR
jgi:hypothetical protein